MINSLSVERCSDLLLLLYVFKIAYLYQVMKVVLLYLIWDGYSNWL